MQLKITNVRFGSKGTVRIGIIDRLNLHCQNERKYSMHTHILNIHAVTIHNSQFTMPNYLKIILSFFILSLFRVFPPFFFIFIYLFCLFKPCVSLNKYERQTIPLQMNWSLYVENKKYTTHACIILNIILFMCVSLFTVCSCIFQYDAF